MFNYTQLYSNLFAFVEIPHTNHDFNKSIENGVQHMHSPGGRKRNPSPLDSLSIYRYRFIRQLFGTLTISPMDTRGLPFRKHSLNIIAAHKQNPSCSCIRLTQFSSNYSIYQNAPLAIPKLPCIRLETPGGFFKVYFII